MPTSAGSSQRKVGDINRVFWQIASSRVVCTRVFATTSSNRYRPRNLIPYCRRQLLNLRRKKNDLRERLGRNSLTGIYSRPRRATDLFSAIMGPYPAGSTALVAAAGKRKLPRANQDGALVFGLPGCVDYKRLFVADRLIAWPARCAADKCAVFCIRALRRIRYLPACLAVTRCAIVFASRPISKNHGCCTDAAGIYAPKSWAGVFDGLPLLVT
jgi:hypothetical protein